MLRAFLNCSLLNYRVSQLDPELTYMASPANQLVPRIPHLCLLGAGIKSS